MDDFFYIDMGPNYQEIILLSSSRVFFVVYPLFSVVCLHFPVFYPNGQQWGYPEKGYKMKQTLIFAMSVKFRMHGCQTIRQNIVWHQCNDSITRSLSVFLWTIFATYKYILQHQRNLMKIVTNEAKISLFTKKCISSLSV